MNNVLRAAPIIIFSLGTQSLFAAEIGFDFSLNPSVKYEDNVFLSENSAQSSYIYSAKPSISSSYKKDGLDLNLSTGYSLQRYSSIQELNVNNPFVELSSKRIFERSTLSLQAKYVTDATRENVELDTGDFSSTSTVTRRTLAAGHSYNISEKYILKSSLSYSDSSFSSQENNDEKSTSVSGNLIRIFSDRLSAGIDFTHTQASSSGLLPNVDNDFTIVSTTFNYNWSENLSAGGRFGLTRQDTTTAINSASIESSSTEPSYSVNLAYSMENSKVSVDLSQTIVPTSRGQTIIQESVGIIYNRSHSETLSSSIRLRYLSSSDVTELDSTDREFISFSPSLTWKLQRNMSLVLNYEYRQQDQKSQRLDSSSNGNIVAVNFKYDWDGIKLSR